MTLEKVKELQDYLAEYGIEVSEVAIISASVDIAKRLGADMWTFVCEFVENPNDIPILEAGKRGREKERNNEYQR